MIRCSGGQLDRVYVAGDQVIKRCQWVSYPASRGEEEGYGEQYDPLYFYNQFRLLQLLSLHLFRLLLFFRDVLYLNIVNITLFSYLLWIDKR